MMSNVLPRRVRPPRRMAPARRVRPCASSPLHTFDDWAAAAAALPAAGLLPVRTVLVASERQAHALRRALARDGRASALAGLRFTTPLQVALETLARAGQPASPGEEALRPARLLALFGEDLPLEHYPLDLLRTHPGWEEAFAQAIGVLEQADLCASRPPLRRRAREGSGAGVGEGDRRRRAIVDGRPDRGRGGPPAGARPESLPVSRAGAGGGHRARGRGAGSPAARHPRPHARAVAGEAGHGPPPGAALAAVRAGGARRRRDVPPGGARWPPGGSREVNSRTVARPAAPPGAASHAGPEPTERDLLAAHLFQPPEVLGAPGRPRSRGPDGTVLLEEHAGVEAEVEAAAGWVARQVLEAGIPLQEVAVLVPAGGPLVQLVAERLSRLPCEGGALPVFVAGGLPASATSAGARLLATVRALAAHLSASSLAAVLPAVRLAGPRHQLTPHLSHGEAMELAFSLGTAGGNAAFPEGALEWSSRAEARAAELAGALAHARTDEDSAARETRRLERTLADLEAARPALDALVGVARAVVGGATLAAVWEALHAFAVRWLHLPGDAPAQGDRAGGAPRRGPRPGLRGAAGSGAHRHRRAGGGGGTPPRAAPPHLPLRRAGRVRGHGGERGRAGAFRGARAGPVRGRAPLAPPREPGAPRGAPRRAGGGGAGARPAPARGSGGGPASRAVRGGAGGPAGGGALGAAGRSGAHRARAGGGLHRGRGRAGEDGRRGRRRCGGSPSVGRLSLQPPPFQGEEEISQSPLPWRGRGPGRGGGDPPLAIPDLRALGRDYFAPARAEARRFREAHPVDAAAWLERAASLGPDLPAAWRAAPALDLARIARLRSRSGPLGPADGVLGAGGPFPPVPGLEPERPISASALQHLLQCPRMFLMRRVLGWDEPAAASSLRELEPTAFGSLLHEAVEAFYRAHGQAFVAGRASLAHWQGVAAGLADGCFAAFLSGYPLVGERIREKERRRLLDAVSAFLAHDWAQNRRGRRFVGVEVGFGEEAPLALRAGGRTLHVRGFIDRLDVDGGVTTVRDLKSGKHHPRTGREAGPTALRDVQLGLYLAGDEAPLPAARRAVPGGRGPTSTPTARATWRSAPSARTPPSWRRPPRSGSPPRPACSRRARSPPPRWATTAGTVRSCRSAATRSRCARPRGCGEAAGTRAGREDGAERALAAYGRLKLGDDEGEET